MAYMSHTGYLCVLPRIVRLVHLVGLQAIGAGGQVLLQHLVQILASMCSRSLARHPGLERLAGLKLYGFNGLYEPYRLFMCPSPHLVGLQAIGAGGQALQHLVQILASTPEANARWHH